MDARYIIQNMVTDRNGCKLVAHADYSKPFEKYVTFKFRSRPERKYYICDRSEMEYEAARQRDSRVVRLFAFFLHMARHQELYSSDVLTVEDVNELCMLE